MKEPVFVDRARPPGEADLAAALGTARAPWDAVRRTLEQDCPGVTLAWTFYGPKHGWQLKARRGARAVAYLIPHPGRFTVGLALRDGEVARLREAGLPPALERALATAAPAPEGRPLRLEVAGPRAAALARRVLLARAGAPR